MKFFTQKYCSLALFFISIILIELTRLTCSNPIDAKGLNEIDSIDVNQILQKSKELNVDSSSTVHRRVKRQYFKPSIDGSGLANERTIMLKSARNANSMMSINTNENASNSNDESLFSSSSSPFPDQTTISSLNNVSTSSGSQANETSLRKKVEVSVTSLSLSLINLFDRVKGTLCNLVKIECGHVNTNQSSIVK